ncbi:MAG: hypothetical protein RMX96_21130 [Nostoc sp. ChiSLP02]|nr:hypothetical protein [Nostoc sp. DedSLP05]MDZ8100431.1 hypothetical protein [Nostoc sp. DedSLP01]MDZ8187338.1 hypothetical protein [Nostoc sp. ChiSLP02]
MPTAWLLYEMLRVACFPVGVRVEQIIERHIFNLDRTDLFRPLGGTTAVDELRGMKQLP